jgi:hypothetical protein
MMLIIVTLFASALALPRLQSGELGFDILRLKPKGRVFESVYNGNLTPDLAFEIADNSIAVNIFDNSMAVNSQIDYHSTNMSSSVFESCSISAHGSAFGIGVSGSYTEESSDFRASQQGEKTSMIRTTYKGRLYSVQHDIFSAKLTDNIYSTIMGIIDLMRKGEHSMAKYGMETLLAAYGDSVMTSLTYGGAMMTYVIVDTNWLNTVSEQTAMKAGSASFSAFFGGVSGSAMRKTDDQDLTSMMNNSRIFRGKTYGGKIKNVFTIEDFVASLFAGEIVPIDGTNVNICEIMSPSHLKNNTYVDILAVKALCNKVRDEYFDVNLPLGCMNMLSANYNPNALRDDGSCKAPVDKYTFFGAYQTCKPASFYDSCDGYQQKNPRTNDYSCGINAAESSLFNDVVVDNMQLVTVIDIATACGGIGPDQYACVYANIAQVTNEANEIFIDSYTKCTGGTSYPQLPSSGCGERCHGWWFNYDCRNDCSASIWYRFPDCDDSGRVPWWCEQNRPYLACYNNAQNEARGYFYNNWRNKKIGHIIDVHFCVPKNATNPSGLVGFNVLGFYTNTIPNPVARTPGCPIGSTNLRLFNTPGSTDGLNICIANDNMTPYIIPWGGISSCQVPNPYVTPAILGCSPGYSRYYATFNGLCELLICLDMSHIDQINTRPVVKDLPFMEMPMPKVSLHNFVPQKIKQIHSYLTHMTHNNMFANASIPFRSIPIATDISIITPASPMPSASASAAPSASASAAPSASPSSAPSASASVAPSASASTAPIVSAVTLSDPQTTNEHSDAHNNTKHILIGFAVSSAIFIVIGVFIYAKYKKIKTNASNHYVVMPN